MSKVQPQGDMLVVKGLTYRFAPEIALFQDLNMRIGQGEFVSFLAPSGLGKTTLFRLIAGLLQPDGGSITLAPKAASAAEGKGRVGYMPQQDCLMPWRRVWENAAIGLEIAGVSRGEAKRRVMELLPSFGLEGKENHYPSELSGGMRQRVSFLRTLLGGYDLLLLDEPFGSLDAITRLEMQEWLLKIWEQFKTTVLFITHDVEEALFLSDRVLVAYEAPIKNLHSITVPLTRPRSYDDLLDAGILAAKKEIVALLKHRSLPVIPVGTPGGGS